VFSGIVEVLGDVRSMASGDSGARISIEAGALVEGVKLGDSIAINGACMTVVAFGNSMFETDISPESLRMTNLGDLKAGDKVNLEKALALGDRLGGHMVTGHIDGMGKIRDRKADGDSIWLTVEAPPDVMRYVVFKGSIAVDGISLTVATCDEDSFSIAIIPHTSEHTTLTAKRDGAVVNLEADLIGKYVEKLLSPHAQARAGGVSMDKLKEHGYA
jgi:riboflavin synthase